MYSRLFKLLNLFQLVFILKVHFIKPVIILSFKCSLIGFLVMLHMLTYKKMCISN